MRVLNLRYHKRFQMELDLRRLRPQTPALHPDYRLSPWSPELVYDHAEVKYLSFRDELDAVIFPCLGDLEGCVKLMQEICERDGFVPEATWLARYVGAGPRKIEPCGTIQAIRVHRNRANIQNIGVTPHHRGRGLGSAMVCAAVLGLHQVGVTRVALEVTADNQAALRLYRRLGFHPTKTVYKTTEQLSDDSPRRAVR
ncbi:MAG: GNAT family N-acetyltransferase [Planctomycetota bacterium]|nr:MAG: GNAT family N-acetyltransferase [Planctomycetota bacterium]